MDPEIDATLRETLDSLREGLQILAPDWRYLYVNEALAQHGRKKRDELLGRTMMESYPGIEKTPLFSVLERCMRERVEATFENEFTYEDGTSAFFELRVRPCRAGIIVLSVDVTERHAIEARLAAERERALLELKAPVIRVHDRVLLLPLVGPIDAERSAQITETALSRVIAEQARALIVDVAGVPEMDAVVADSLVRMASAVRLLGARTIMTGISAASAATIVRLGVDLATMRTTSQLAEGIELALGFVDKTGKTAARR